MEKQESMVTIPLSEYEQLKEFKEKIESGKSFNLHNWMGKDSFFYMTSNQTSDFLLNKMVSMNDKIGLLEKQLYNFEKMSFYQLKQWWRQNRIQ